MTCTVGDKRGRRTRTNPTFYVLCHQSDKQCETLLPTSGSIPPQPPPPTPTPQYITVLHPDCKIPSRDSLCVFMLTFKTLFSLPSLNLSTSRYLISENHLVCASLRRVWLTFCIFYGYGGLTDVWCAAALLPFYLPLLAGRHLKHRSEISCKKPRCWRHMVLIPIHARQVFFVFFSLQSTSTLFLNTKH